MLEFGALPASYHLCQTSMVWGEAGDSEERPKGSGLHSSTFQASGVTLASSAHSWNLREEWAQPFPPHRDSQWGGGVSQRKIKEHSRDAVQVEITDAYHWLRASREGQTPRNAPCPPIFILDGLRYPNYVHQLPDASHLC